MGKTYLKTVFNGRRLSFINFCPEMLFREAFRINSQKQVIYEIDKKTACDFNDKKALWCFDILVKPVQKDSIRLIMQQMLNQLFPVKARIEKRVIPVYVLHLKAGAANWKASGATESTFGFTGMGFDGTAIAMSVFVDYLTNELGLPVVDETGLKDKYDINTENVLRSKENILAAIEKLGLTVEKGEREMSMLVIYK